MTAASQVSPFPTPSPSVARARTRPPGLRRATEFLAPSRGAIACILALAGGVALAGAVEPLALREVLDGLGRGGGWGAALGALGALAAIGLAREGMQATASWLTWRTRIQVHYRLTEATVGRLHRLPLEFHRAEGVGATMTRLERSIQGLVGALAELAFSSAPAVAYLVISTVVMFRLEPRLALLVLAFAPLPALVARAAAPAQARRERALLERWVKIYSRFNEVLSGILTVKSFAMEDAEKSRFLGAVREANGVVVRGVGMDTGVGAAQSAVQLAARVAALAYGGVLVARGELSVGTLVAFLGYVGGLFGPVLGLAGMYRTLRTARVSAEEVYRILDAQDSLGDAPDALDVSGLRGDVTWEGVHFNHPGRAPILRGVNLEVRAGERVAVVGPSGAGKSTLVQLVQRFFDPSAGAVRIDGIDVRRLKQISLRRQIGTVLQDPLLFDESVHANIAYGRPGATRAEVEEAARAAHAHEFVSRLPEGYDTRVGERGSRLSVGERQRIAIARALLKDPAILILDEPTSALDAESEALVQEALDRVAAGRTTLVVAHRLSTVLTCDRIVVLADGHVVEQGTHAELLARDGTYASMVRRQARGLLPLAA